MSTKHEDKGWAVFESDLKAIAWNTGAEYTQFGQRIAAGTVDGGVWFVDVDRGIHGWMPGCHLTESAVMHRYHAGDYKSVPPPVYDLNVRQFRTSDYQDGTVTRVIGLYAAFRAALEKMAKAVPAPGEKAEPSMASMVSEAITKSIRSAELVQFEVGSKEEAYEAMDAIRAQSVNCDCEDNGEDTLVWGKADKGEGFRLLIKVTTSPRGWESVEGGAR